MPKGAILVVDDEVGGVAQVPCVHAQYSGGAGVKGGHPELLGLWSHDFRHPLPHLCSGLVGEGDSQDLPGLDTSAQ